MAVEEARLNVADVTCAVASHPVAPVEQEPLDDAPLGGWPGVEAAEDFRGGVARQIPAIAWQAHPVVAQETEQAVGDLGATLDGLLVGVEAIPSLLGFGVRDPDDSCRAGQVALGDADGADLVGVGVGLLEFAQVGTFEDQSPSAERLEGAHDVEAVAGGLQDNEVLRGGVLLGPTAQLGHGELVVDPFDDGLRRGLSAQHGGGEAVGVRIETDHALDRTGCLVQW